MVGFRVQDIQYARKSWPRHLPEHFKEYVISYLKMKLLCGHFKNVMHNACAAFFHSTIEYDDLRQSSFKKNIALWFYNLIECT